MQKLKRGCWWCGNRLMAVSHAVTKDGRWVHKCCLDEAEESLRYLTAKPPDTTKEGK